MRRSNFHSPLCLVLAAAILLAVPGIGRCDNESEVLLQYRARVDTSIELALAYLAGEYAKADKPAGALFPGWMGETNAMAGLVGMAFLSKGYIPGESQYGPLIDACVDRIVSTDIAAKPAASLPAGYLGGPNDKMYGHAIATLFLSEASGMVDPGRQAKIDAILPKAIKVILDAQNIAKMDANLNGGWRYLPNSPDSDISVTGWCMMALRSAKLNGAPVPSSAVDRAVVFVEHQRNPDGGFDYNRYYYHRRGYWISGPSTPSRTGVALLSRELAGRHDDEINQKAAEFILSRMGTWQSEPFVEYANYYCAQGMFQLGGNNWERFGQFLYSITLSSQSPNGAWEGQQSPIYTTAMNVLALSVSCRQLPIYQR